MVTIIDYGICNLKSVANAFDFLGAAVVISNKPEDILKAKRLVLPGVGSFDQGMKNLKNLKLIEILNQAVIEEKKPFLGICLGMQMLATTGHEGRLTGGLNWINGEVKKLEAEKLKIPHIGWDEIDIAKETPLFSGIGKEKDFYFVHSYRFIPKEKEVIVATCDYGENFAAAVQKDNIFATQFHPEKSQRSGIKLLANFLEWKP